VCGNGGSASDAEHIVGELMKSVACKRPILRRAREAMLAMSPEAGDLADALEGPGERSLVSQIGLIWA
jgi:D-sedoheptulose 7-phosphate isomerase